jgi:hypothetical protein
MEGGFCEDVFYDTAGESSGTLIMFLRDIHPQPRLDVFAVLSVHDLAS